MKLVLTRPLAVIDLETTGTNTEKDRIVEISVTKLFPDYTRTSVARKVNPGMPIPKGASDVHGITDEMVANEPTFSQISKSLLTLLEGCDIAGFNSNRFDIPFLFSEFARAGIEWDYTKFLMVDAGNLFKILSPRTLTAAVLFYLNRDHEGAHSAQADTEATLDVLLAQLEKHGGDEGFPQTLDALALFSNFDKKVVDLSGKFEYDEAGEIILAFGKHKGEIAKTQKGFLNWMLGVPDMPADSKFIARQIIAGKR